MWSYSGNVSFAVGATGCTASAELIAAAASREELNELYVKNGTLLILKDGRAKAAYKVSQTGGRDEPFRVHFAANPGSKPVRDTLVAAGELAKINAVGLDGADHMMFGFRGGAFRGTDGSFLHVVDAVAPLSNEDTISKLSVVQWVEGAVRPDLANATELTIDDFFKEFYGKQLGAPTQESICVGEMPLVACVLHASKLTMFTGPGLGHGPTDQVALRDMEQFLSAVYYEEVVGRVKALSATARLEGLLAGKTALREGDGWHHARDNGMVEFFSAKQAGAFLRQTWFIQQPTLVDSKAKKKSKEKAVPVSDDDDDGSSSGSGSGSEDDDSDSEVEKAPQKRKRRAAEEPLIAPKVGKHTKVTRDSELRMFVPRCGTLSRIETARIIFEEEKVRRLADADPIPDDATMAGREFRFESRANEALQRLLGFIGTKMVPSKPPKDERALQRTAEDIFSAVGAVVRGGSSSGKGRPSSKRAKEAASDSDEEQTSSRPQQAKSTKEARAAVPADVAGRLFDKRVELRQQWSDVAGDPVRMMASVVDVELRNDLQRAMASNGMVYAPGETAARKRNLIPTVHEMREAMIAAVVNSVRACAGSDKSGITHVSEAQALPLAEKALAGEFEWSKFSAASKTMRQRTAKAVGSVGELAQTYEMMEAAWAASIHLLFGVVNDAGLRDLRQQLGSSADRQAENLAQEQRKPYVEKLTLWVTRVTEHYAEAAYRFRRSDSAVVSVSDSLSALDTMFSRIDSQADTASEMAATWFKQPKQQPRPAPYSGGGGGGAADKPPKKGAAAESEAVEKISKSKKRRLKEAEKKKPRKPAAKEESTDDEEVAGAPAQGWWPDRPKMETPEWLKCQQAFQTKWPDACCWHHISKCKRGANCSRSHDKAEGFDAWKQAKSWQ